VNSDLQKLKMKGHVSEGMSDVLLVDNCSAWKDYVSFWMISLKHLFMQDAD